MRIRVYVSSIAILVTAVTQADFIPQNEYFIGVDGLQTIATGTYAGLANPNFGRLTFLYGHQYDGSTGTPASSSHYHSKAVFTYSGPAESPTVVTSASNYVPEGSNIPLNLLAGSGSLSGYLVSGLEDRHFANTSIRPTSWLNRAGAQEWEVATFNSSSGRWTGSLGSADLAIEVVGLTNGLTILNDDGTTAADSAGDLISLGPGDFAATPIFGVSSSAAVGPYAAQLRIRDLSNTFANSGVFEFRYQVQPVPEPATLAALIIGTASYLRKRRKLSKS